MAGRERERLLTTEEAAKAIGVSRSTLIRYAERNYVPLPRCCPPDTDVGAWPTYSGSSRRCLHEGSVTIKAEQ